VARPRRRSCLGSGEMRENAGKQMVVEALLGARGGAWWLGRLWKRAEGPLHRGGSNGGPAGRCACAGTFYRRGRGRGGVRASSRRKGEGVKERRAATKTQRASPAGDAVGGPAGASADGHTQV
jgi:hypothetical protein